MVYTLTFYVGTLETFCSTSAHAEANPTQHLSEAGPRHSTAESSQSRPQPDSRFSGLTLVIGGLVLAILRSAHSVQIRF